MNTINKDIQSKLIPAEVLEMLKDGNHRFVNNLKINRNLLQQVNDTKEGQYPVAVILSCIDSRTSAELIFDLGLGDIFSVRLAGNVLNEDVLGSMEFACKIAGAKMIVVLGHTKCGAVNGAINEVKMGYVTQMVSKIAPAVKKAKQIIALQPGTPYDMANLVAEQNVHLTIEQIVAKSDILREMINKGEIGIAGGMYDVESGLVEFYEEDTKIEERKVAAMSTTKP